MAKIDPLIRSAFAFAVFLFAHAFAGEPPPLTGAHAHNDYLHARPLRDALEHGFGSVEADVHLVAGELLVAHDAKNVQPGRTLAALYLDPLRERVRANGGRVYRDGPTVTLLVDVKTAAAPTYAALDALLRNYAEMVTEFTAGHTTTTRAITVIVSGNRAVKVMAAQKTRFAALDGRPEDLDTNPSVALVPLISASWERISTWAGRGEIPPADWEKLQALVARTHAQHRQLRFWATPDRPEVWRVLRDAGVDVLGADNLDALRAFLAAR